MTALVAYRLPVLPSTSRTRHGDVHAVSPARAEGAPAIPSCTPARPPAPEHGPGGDRRGEAAARGGIPNERKTEDGWPPDRLVPLLAGLLELVPWLEQWHNAPRDDFGGDGPGDWYERYVEAEARSLGNNVDVLRVWRPEKKSVKR